MSLVNSCSLDQGFEAPRRYLAAAAILIGVLMAALDSSIVNVALPSIASALRV
ncbi:MFS transporter, partial [Klebsiella aerogenes]